MRSERHDDCRAFESRLELLVDGELREDEARRDRGHAAACPRCAHLLRTEFAIKEVLAGLGCPPCPDIVSARAEALAASSSARRRRLRLVAAGVASGLAVAALALIVAQSSAPAPPEPDRPSGTYDVARAQREFEGTLALLAHVGHRSCEAAYKEVVDKSIAPSMRAAWGNLTEPGTDETNRTKGDK